MESASTAVDSLAGQLSALSVGAAAGPSSSGLDGPRSGRLRRTPPLHRDDSLHGLIKAGHQTGQPDQRYRQAAWHVWGFNEKDDDDEFARAARAVVGYEVKTLGELAAVPAPKLEELQRHFAGLVPPRFMKNRLASLAELARRALDVFLRSQRCVEYRAVSLGANDYLSRWWPQLATAEADAVALEDLLRGRGYRLPPDSVVRPMADRGEPGDRCSAALMGAAIDWLCQKVDRKPDERAMAVFGFSGHGFSVDHQLMLVPSDVQYALGVDTRPMPLHWLESKLREAGFTDVVLILGCCQTDLDACIAPTSYRAFIADNLPLETPTEDLQMLERLTPSQALQCIAGPSALAREVDRTADRVLKIMATGENMAAVDSHVRLGAAAGSVAATSTRAAAPAPATTTLSPFMEALLGTWGTSFAMPSRDLSSRFADRYRQRIGRAEIVPAFRLFGQEVMSLDPPLAFRR